MVSSGNGSGVCQFLPPAQWCPLRMGRVFVSSFLNSIVSSKNGSGVCQFLPQINGVLREWDRCLSVLPPDQWCPQRMGRVFVSSSSRSLVSSENGPGVCQFFIQINGVLREWVGCLSVPPQPNGVLREWDGCLSVPPPDQWCPLRMGRVFASSSPRSMVSSDNGSGGCQFLPPPQLNGVL